MALFNNSSSHLTVCFEEINQTSIEIVESLKSMTVKNILGKEDFGTTGYQGINEENPSELIVFEDFISLVEVSQDKVFPNKFINAKVNKMREDDPQYKGMSKKEFKEECFEELKYELMKEMSPLCTVKTSKTQILINLKTKRIYLEGKNLQKSYVTLNKLERLLGIEGLYIKNRFSKRLLENINHSILSELFIFWLYNKAMSDDFKDKLKMSSKLSIKDGLTKIAISGKIENFIEIYKDLKNNRKIDKIFLELPEDLEEDSASRYKFEISTKDTIVRSFKDLHYSCPKTIVVSTLFERSGSLENMDIYLDKLVHAFEKDIEGEEINELFCELRGLQQAS